MPFEFADLNAQLGLTQQCVLYTTQTICQCLSRPFLSCRCLSRNITYCICNSRPIISYRTPTFELECGYSLVEHVVDVSRELVQPVELDQLRRELETAMKHLDVQKEVLERTMAPQTDAQFDEAEAALKQQLELLQKQRAERGRGGKK